MSYSIKFKGIPEDVEWNELMPIFKSFGKATKLFVHPEKLYGKVSFNDEREALKVYKACNNQPPYNLQMKRPMYNSGRLDLDKTSEHNGTELSSSSSSVSLNNLLVDSNEVIAEMSHSMVDIHGNPIDTLIDDNGVCYVPLHQVKAAGFKLFNRKDFNKRLISDEQILEEFMLHMLGEAKKFMIDHQKCIPDHEIETTIERLKNKVFQNNSNYTNSNSTNNNSRHTDNRKSVENNSRPTVGNRLKLGNFTRTVTQTQPSQSSPSNQNFQSLRKPATPEAVSNRPKPESFRGISGNNTKKEETPRSQIKVPPQGKLNAGEVVVTHVENSSVCFVNVVADLSKVDSITYDVNRYAVNSKKIEPVEGNMCTANLLGAWARAIVLSTKPQLKVMFIDYGKQQVVTEVRGIAPELCKEPALAYLIKFEAENNKIEVGDRFGIILIKQFDEGYIVRLDTNCNAAVPKIINSTPKSASPLQTKSRTPFRKMPSPINVPHSSRRSIIDDANCDGVLCYKQGLNANSFVAFVCSETYYEQLEKLEEISKCVQNREYRPKIRDTVALNYEDDNTWARGVVINITDDTYECALIDYGVIVSTKDVRELPEEFQNIPEFTCVCRTEGETAKKIKQAGDDVRYSVKDANSLLLTIDKSQYVVFVERWNPFGSSPAAEHKKTKQKVYTRVPPAMTLGEKDVVKILRVEGKELLVKTRECYMAMKKMKADIDNFEGPPLETPPVVGQLVLSPCNDESGLFRALIEEVKGCEASVYFIDYGNHDLIALKHLRNLNDDLAAVECNLIKIANFTGFKNNECSTEISNYLEKNSSVKYTVIFNNKEVDFVTPEGGLLSEILTSLTEKPKPEKLAKPIETPKESTPIKTNNPVKEPTSGNARVQLGDLPAPDVKLGQQKFMCVYAGDLKYGMVTFVDAVTAGPLLQSLQTQIDEYVEICNETHTPELIEVVIAKYEDMWYRGVVLEANVDDYSIFFIDYGNTDVVQKNDIKKLPQSMSKIPPASFICILEGVVKEEEEEVPEALFSKLSELIEENETYIVDVLECSRTSSTIRIPSVYKQITSLL